MKPTTKAYIAGTLVMAAIMSLRQDWHGLEGYIERLRNGWVDASITVPIALAVIIAGAWLYLSALKGNRSQTVTLTAAPGETINGKKSIVVEMPKL